MFMDCVRAFIVGGALCVIGQLLIDITKLTPARILVCYVVAGVVLTAIGIYEPLVRFGGAGATVPLTGFGYSLAMLCPKLLINIHLPSLTNHQGRLALQ